MKNILIILAFITSSALFSACGNNTSTSDFSSPETAAESYFHVLKSLNQEEVKTILLTYDEFLTLKNTAPSFAKDLPRLGETDSAQYAGVIAETIGDYNRNFKSSASKNFLNTNNFATAEYTGADVTEEAFYDLTVAPINIRFQLKDGKKYAVKVRAVKVNGNWKAVYFDKIGMAR